MAVDDEMAWEPRLPQHSIRRLILARRPSTQPVPERFEIVVADLLATLTFDPVLGPSPRTRHRAQRPRHPGPMIFDPVSHLAPVVWEPQLPSGLRARKAQSRTRRHQESREPVPLGVIVAPLMAWEARLPSTKNSRRRWRPRDSGVKWELEFSVLAAGVVCTELSDETLTNPAFLAESLTSPVLITESLTSPTLLDEGFC